MRDVLADDGVTGGASLVAVRRDSVERWRDEALRTGRPSWAWGTWGTGVGFGDDGAGYCDHAQ